MDNMLGNSVFQVVRKCYKAINPPCAVSNVQHFYKILAGAAAVICENLHPLRNNQMIDSVSEHAGAGPDLKKARRQKTLAQRGASTLDRLPPHDLTMEQGVLGCILLSPNESMGECIEKLKDDGKEAFYDLRHQTIYETVSTMFNSRAPIDLITVQQDLKDRQLLEQIGGIAYLSQLQDSVPSAANLSYYLEKVRRNTCCGG